MKARKKARWDRGMRRTELRIPLSQGFEIYGRYVRSRGRVVEFAVVLLLQRDDGDFDQICRYDTEHGFAHLDILDRKGKLIKKLRIDDVADYQEALEYALDDFKENYETYASRYFAS